jgi:hypothetical protein
LYGGDRRQTTVTGIVRWSGVATSRWVLISFNAIFMLMLSKGHIFLSFIPFLQMTSLSTCWEFSPFVLKASSTSPYIFGPSNTIRCAITFVFLLILFGAYLTTLGAHVNGGIVFEGRHSIVWISPADGTSMLSLYSPYTYLVTTASFAFDSLKELAK